MNQLSLIITQGACVITWIIASSLNLVAVQEPQVQPKSTQKVSSDEIVDKLKRATQGRVVAMLDRRENNDLVWKKVK